MQAMDPDEAREQIRDRYNLIGTAPEPKETTPLEKDPFPEDKPAA